MAYIGIGPASFTNNLTNVQILDDIKSQFNGSKQNFDLTSNDIPFQAVSDRALMVILGGVIQAPGVDYTINGDEITFTTAPVSGLTFYARNIYGLNALNKVNDGIVGPYSLTTGGPTWDTSGNITISGNLTVQGSTTTIQSTTLDVIDKDIKLASNQSTNAGIDTAGLLWGTTAVKLKYYNNGGTNPGLNIEGTNVGIGVTAPTAKLQVDAGAVSLNSLLKTTSASSLIGFEHNAGSSYTTRIGSKTLGSGNVGLVFDTGTSGGSTKMTIDVNGKVGIGADAPDCLLHIQGTEISGYGAHANTKLCVEHDGNTAIEIVSSANYLGGIYFSDSGADGVGKIEYYHGTGGNNMRFNTNGDERLRIDSSGNLRFGQTTQITCNTADGSDNQAIYIGGGGGSAQTRGAQILLHGNEYAGGYNGTLELLAGNTGNTQGTIDFFTAGNKRVTIKSTGHLKLPDDGKIEFGGAQNVDGDLQIYHAAGGDSTIHHTATGSSTIRLRSRGFTFKNQANSETIATFNEGDACKLFFSNSEKIATTSTGISVTGEVSATQDYPNYRPTLDFNFAAVKKLDPRITYYRTGVASYVNEFGIVKVVGTNTPRFDHDPTTRESKGLLMEPSRTNILPYSSDESKWGTNSNGTLTRNAGTAPDGTETATKISTSSTDMDTGPTVSNGDSTTYIAISGGTAYTFSVWAKASTAAQVGNNFKVRMKRTSGTLFNPEATFTLTANWKQYSVTGSTHSNNVAVWCYVGGVTGSEALVWGAQLEAGNHPTSLIPTSGSSKARGEDVAIIEGTEFTDFFNATEGTSVVHAHMPVSSGASGLPAYAFKNTSVSQHTLQFSRDNGSDPAYHYYHDGSNTAFTRASATGDNMYKGAMSFKTGDLDSYVNGTLNVHTTSFTMPPFDNLRFGGVGGANTLGGHIARFMYYPVKLTNNQLMTLTS
tara:strand:- start:3451 stop:6261 length:2811 start_codon:yes stop_codon:yes gene_type:complete